MATYWVNSAASGGSAPYSTVGTGAASLGALLTYINATPGWDPTDKIFVLNTHSVTYASIQTWVFPDTFIVPVIAVDSSGNMMPTAGNTSKPQEFTGAFGGANISMSGNAAFYGIWFAAGRSNTSSSALNIGVNNASNCTLIFNNCMLEIGTTSGPSRIFVGIQASAVKALNFIFRNCAFRFNNAAQKLQLTGGRMEFLNCLTNGGTTPNYVFDLLNAKVIVKGGSYNFNTSLVSLDVEDPGEMDISEVSMPSLPMTAGAFDTLATYGGPEVRAWSFGSSATTWTEHIRNTRGAVDNIITKYLTAAVGMPDNAGSTVRPTRQMTTTSNPDQVSVYRPLYTRWIPVFVGSTGSKTISMEVAYDSVSLYTNQQAWMEVAYMGNEAIDSTTDLAIRYSGPTATVQQVATGTSTIVHNVQGSSSSLTNTSASWTGTFTNLKTATLSTTITVDQVGWISVRVAFCKSGSVLLVCPDVTVS